MKGAAPVPHLGVLWECKGSGQRELSRLAKGSLGVEHSKGFNAQLGTISDTEEIVSTG